MKDVSQSESVKDNLKILGYMEDEKSSVTIKGRGTEESPGPERSFVAKLLFDGLSEKLSATGLRFENARLFWPRDKSVAEVYDQLREMQLVPKLSVSQEIDDLLSKGNLVIE